MSQTTIPLQFESYLQRQISEANAPDMNEIVFAYLPDLDLASPIDRNQGLPDETTWVYQQDVDQVGKVGESALAYSVVIPSTVPAFTFNAIYLHDKKVASSCGVIVYKIDETKENGMSSTKSLLQAYSGAAELAGVTVDAATWQIDYQARLLGIDNDHRLACLDHYGPALFLNGFDVTQQADPTKYEITAGIVYVGGLRAVLEDAVIQTMTTAPTTLYIDVYRDGSALSAHLNNMHLFTAETEFSDYVDVNGKRHYVARVATIDADGHVVDARVFDANEILVDSLLQRVERLENPYKLRVLPDLTAIESDGTQCILEFYPDGTALNVGGGVASSWLDETGEDWSGRFEIKRHLVSGDSEEGTGTLNYDVWTPLDDTVSIIRPYGSPGNYTLESISIRDKIRHKNISGKSISMVA